MLRPYASDYNTGMDNATMERLLDLNRQFYQDFGQQFSATRMRLQPGVKRVLDDLPPKARLLDLGCGNGELWRALKENGHRGAYIGLDFSSALINIARTKADGDAKATFIQADLSQYGWSDNLPDDGFDIVLAFAVLHHLPGRVLPLRILKEVRRLLVAEGLFYHSQWQFLNSERLRQRIQPWQAIGLSADHVDPGDYLLDWRRGGYGMRYVHHYNLNELADLAAESGFELLESFLSDGHGGNLGLYQAWIASSSGPKA
jgi:SAM-dependent methyltransferase